MENKLTRVFVASLALASTLSSGCSFLFAEVNFEPPHRIRVGESENFVRAAVITHRRSWLAFGPPVVPLVPWPAGEIPQLSSWRTLSVAIQATNPTVPIELDLSDSRLRVPGHGAGQVPISIDPKCVGQAAGHTGSLLTLPAAAWCIVYLDFGISPEHVEEFDLVLGATVINGQRHEFPVTHHAKEQGCDYRPFALPLF